MQRGSACCLPRLSLLSFTHALPPTRALSACPRAGCAAVPAVARAQHASRSALWRRCIAADRRTAVRASSSTRSASTRAGDTASLPSPHDAAHAPVPAANAGATAAEARACAPQTSASEPSQLLTPAVAAALVRRTQESVLRQERCAADLLYFISAERHARRQQRQHQKQLRDDISSSQVAPLAVEGQPASSHVLDMGAVPPPHAHDAHREKELHAHEAAVRDGRHRQRRRTSALFRQQQALFALRRRLAYLLADGESSSDAVDVAAEAHTATPEEGLEAHVRRSGRRTALALSLAQSILRVSAANPAVAVQRAEGSGSDVDGEELQRREDRHNPDRTTSSETFTMSPTSALRLATGDVQGQLPHAYRSLAQPVELSPAEVYALLAWCARHVCHHASAVARAAARDTPLRRPLAAPPTTETMKETRETREDAGAPDCRRLTSATQRPATLHTTAQLQPAGAADPTCESVSRGANHAASLPYNMEEERRADAAEAAVADAVALVELVGMLVRTAAECGLPMADGFPERTRDSLGCPAVATAADARAHAASTGAADAGDSVSGGEVELGSMVADVVASACDALGVLQRRGLLDAYVARRRRGAAVTGNSDATVGGSVASSGTHEGAAAQPSRLLPEEHLRDLQQRLSFSRPVAQAALACTRESWRRALQLAECMAEWNGTLDRGCWRQSGAPATAAGLPDVEGPRGSGFSELRHLDRAVVHLLLYILAQHGRLTEVVRVCRDVCGAEVADLLRGSPAMDWEERPNSEEAKGVASAEASDTATDALLVLLAHIAAANADPCATRAVCGQTASADCHLRSVELIVRAGLVPLRALTVTEYAMLVRRVVGERPRQNAPTPRSGKRSVNTMGNSNGVGWWLSPSQVWRYSAGLPHHVRTALCLMGFHANVRRGLTDVLTLEDLYVVLTVSRQLAARDAVEQRAWQARHGGAGQEASRDGGDARLQRRWANWGVEARPAPLPSVPQPAFPATSATTAASPPSQETPPPPQLVHDRLAQLLLPARRRMASAGSVWHVQQLCLAFRTAHRAVLPASSLSASSGPPQWAAAPGPLGGGSAVLQSLASREMLAVLRAVPYARHITSFWDTALAAASTAAPSSPSLPEGVGEADRVREEVAYALALHAEAAVGDDAQLARRCVAPLPVLAPYLSPYTVAALVQRPFRRLFTWEQCLALLPYTPLGSRSQLWLVRRLAQDREGRRHVFGEAYSAGSSRPPAARAPPFGARATGTASKDAAVAESASVQHVAVPPVFALFPQQALRAAEEILAVRAAPRRSVTSTATASPLHHYAQTGTSHSVASAAVPSAAASDRALLALLLEGHWSRALQVFAQSPPRVQVGGAPHVVRLLVEADVWRELPDTERRPLVRLAVQSSAHGAGGPGALLEEMLHTTLEHGLWHTGLYFHQSVAAEQPELVRQCRRAQRYAAQLCSGLLERTAMTLTVAHMMKAARRSQWAEATACFLRYTTSQRHGGGGGHAADADAGAEADTLSSRGTREGGHASDAPPPSRSTDVPPTTTGELLALAALLNATEPADGRIQQRRSGQGHPGTAPDQAAEAPASPATSPFSLFLVATTGTAAVPPELAHVAHTARYAMLHTPAVWVHALRWLPLSALPLAYGHEQAWRSVCGDNTAKLHALLPPRPPPPATPPRLASAGSGEAEQCLESPEGALAPSASEPPLSLVEAVRRSHRPRHVNETAKERQAAVASALRVLHRAGSWEAVTLLYDRAVESQCMPYASSSTVLDTALQGGAPWQVTLTYFFRMAQHLRPDVSATAIALQACAEGAQWEMAFRVLRQSVLTQMYPVPRLVDLAVSTALHCGVWARALAAAHQYRRTRDPKLAHTVLLTYVRTRHYDDAVEYFYDCTRRGLSPLDASLELAIVASEAASDEYRRTALMVGAIASVLEDLYRMSGAVLEHIIFVQRHASYGAVQWPSTREEPPSSGDASSSSLSCSPSSSTPSPDDGGRADYGGADLSLEGDSVLTRRERPAPAP